MSTESSLSHWADQVEEEAHPLNETNIATSSMQPESIDQTSINTTLRRLQDLRTSIADLPGRTQNSTDEPVPNSRIGPSHSAILLSSGEGSESETVQEVDRLRSTISSAIMSRLEAFEATIQRRLGDLEAGRTLPATRRSQPFDPTRRWAVGSPSRAHHVFREPPSPDLVPQRGSLELSFSRIRGLDHDDEASTGLGRRVAARIAAEANEFSPRVTSGTANTSGASMRLAASRVVNRRVSAVPLEPSTIAGRFHDLQAIPRSGSSAVAREAELGFRSEEASVRAQSINLSNNSRLGSVEDAQSSMPTGTIRRWRIGEVPGSGDSRHLIPENLDSIPRWNSAHIATSTRSGSGRPLDQVNALPMNLSSEPRTSEEGSRYLRHRQQNAGEVEQLNARSWDHGQGGELSTRLPPRIAEQGQLPPGWVEASVRWGSLNPSESLLGREPPPSIIMDSHLEAYQAPAPNAPRRRRGWGKCHVLIVFHRSLMAIVIARLDADGNEISSEDEDILENARIRGRARAFAGIRLIDTDSTDQTSSSTEFDTIRQTLVPMTRTSHPETWDDEGVTARVHIRPSRQGVDVANTHGKGKGRPNYVAPAFKADPLPMPLIDMIPQPAVRHKPVSITRVHPHASLAGR